jgi:carboxyl-terminal processing protease
MPRLLYPFGFLLASVLLLTAFRSDDDLFELRKHFEIFGAVYEEITAGYVNDVRPAPFMRAGIEAMLSQLDPYTQYYDEADMADSRLWQQRNLGGVGITIGSRGGRLAVLAPEGDASAYRTGIRPGDVLLQIGESPTDGMTVLEANELLVGQPGTVIDVLVERQGEAVPRSFSLPRVRPGTNDVSWFGWLGPDSTDAIAYVKLDQFGDRSGREVKRAFRTLNRQIPLEGMVLDLRGNPGGILAEAVELVSIFVPSGSLVVTTRSRADNAIQEYRTDAEPYLPDTPLVILMDEYSASASEIVAGALQDMDRAVILGRTSLGKGLVQVFRPLPHNATLKLTISHYYLPSGRTIQSAQYSSAAATVAVPTRVDFTTPAGRVVRGGRGVEPDVVVDPPVETPIEAALRQESAFFLFASQWVSDRCDADARCTGTDEEMLTGFREWIDRQGFPLTTDLDLLFVEMQALAQAGGNDRVTGELAALKAVINQAKQEQLDTAADRILFALHEEIRSRLLVDQEMVRANLDGDVWVQQGRELVSDRRALAQLLG